MAASESVDGGATAYDHWQIAARRGSEVAIARLTPPELPESVAYLWEWVMELHGRSGAHMAGLNPLNYATLESWMRLTGYTLDPLEVQALIALDAALLDRSEPEPDEPEPVIRDDAWPTRKADG
jgi:hypothetical protein